MAGVDAERVVLSYYGCPLHPGPRTGYLRERLGLSSDTKIVGNINLIYPPKRLLGHTVGLKCHEDVIDALRIVIRRRDDVVGVLIGSIFGAGNTQYESQLRKRAESAGPGRIIMPGYFGIAEVQQSWPDFDCAVHVPMSENCGGVIEPLQAGVPTIASRVGGLPEVVIDGLTGVSVAEREPSMTACAVLRVLNNPEHHKRMAANGQQLVRAMFDIERTGKEVAQIYRHIVDGAARPREFNLRSVFNEGRGDGECARPRMFNPTFQALNT
jgi:glycosyltransferase involved in cell wall biosynthesis